MRLKGFWNNKTIPMMNYNTMNDCISYFRCMFQANRKLLEIHKIQQVKKLFLPNSNICTIASTIWKPCNSSWKRIIGGSEFPKLCVLPKSRQKYSWLLSGFRLTFCGLLPRKLDQLPRGKIDWFCQILFKQWQVS